jgi:hypothetical protein
MFLTLVVRPAGRILRGSQVPWEERMKPLLLGLSALSLLASAAPSIAAPCKDKKGKFIKCPGMPKMCRYANGHFIKCK